MIERLLLIIHNDSIYPVESPASAAEMDCKDAPYSATHTAMGGA